MENHKPFVRTAIITAYLIGILGTFLIMAGLVLAIYRYNRAPALGVDRGSERAKNLKTLRDSDAEWLRAYNWDPGKGIGRIPIEQAMKLTIAEWQDPAAARSNLLARSEKANAPPPRPPEKPSEFE